MTKLIADEDCAACGSVLVPPTLVSGFTTPKEADYVCVRCGRPYRWVGNPPRLTVWAAADRRHDDDDDDAA
jgi:uncharacterized OB-fold protein